MPAFKVFLIDIQAVLMTVHIIIYPVRGRGDRDGIPHGGCRASLTVTGASKDPD
jgi:hypothetical protein